MRIVAGKAGLCGVCFQHVEGPYADQVRLKYDGLI